MVLTQPSKDQTLRERVVYERAIKYLARIGNVLTVCGDYKTVDILLAVAKFGPVKEDVLQTDTVLGPYNTETLKWQLSRLSENLLIKEENSLWTATREGKLTARLLRIIGDLTEAGPEIKKMFTDYL